VATVVPPTGRCQATPPPHPPLPTVHSVPPLRSTAVCKVSHNRRVYVTPRSIDNAKRKRCRPERSPTCCIDCQSDMPQVWYLRRSYIIRDKLPKRARRARFGRACWTQCQEFARKMKYSIVIMYCGGGGGRRFAARQAILHSCADNKDARLGIDSALHFAFARILLITSDSADAVHTSMRLKLCDRPCDIYHSYIRTCIHVGLVNRTDVFDCPRAHTIEMKLK